MSGITYCGYTAEQIKGMAAEIERLTGLYKAAEAQEWSELQEARAEIERLRTAAVWHCEACGTVTRSGKCDCTKMGVAEKQRLVPYDYRACLDAEIERLRAEIERLQRMWAEVCRDYGEARAEIERLRAQNTDLRRI